MKSNLDQIKLNQLGLKCQATLFNPEGKIIESCDTLLKTDKNLPIYDQFHFLLSIQEVIQSVELFQPIEFEMVEWEEQRTGLFGLKFERVNDHNILWFIIDKTEQRDNILSVQQSKNDASINEELLEIRKKYLEAETQLLTFKNEELQRIQKFKERFFAEVSHEIRTPLNSITGLVRLLETSTGKDNHKYLSALKATSKHLNHIINDVLDLSKVDEGKLILEQLSFKLQEIIQTVLQGFSHVAQEKGIYINLSIEPDVPQIVSADPVRLSQILYNIIGNAIKFTHKGGITLHVNLQSKQGKVITLGFEIIDTGIGMSEESIAKILEPYAQVDGQNFHEYGGTGLGMGIAQRLIEIMGGQLSIKSQKGIGTQMSFEINCAEAEDVNYSTESIKHETYAVQPSQSTFLFAEDDMTSLLVLKENLANWNENSEFVTNLQDLQQALIRKKYDLLVTDIHLGEDNALEVIANLRKGDSINQNIPVIFTSGDAQEKHPELEGLDPWGYLVKPFNPQLLVLKIQEMLAASPKQEMEPVDLSALKATALGNMDFVMELIDTILENLPIDLEKLEDAVTDNDFEAARKLLHKMKPSISYLGIPSLLNERNELYQMIEKGKSISDDLVSFKSRMVRALESLATKRLDLIQ